MRLAGADRLQQLHISHRRTVLPQLRRRGEQCAHLPERQAFDDRQTLAQDLTAAQLGDELRQRGAAIDRVTSGAQALRNTGDACQRGKGQFVDVDASLARRPRGTPRRRSGLHAKLDLVRRHRQRPLLDVPAQCEGGSAQCECHCCSKGQ